MNNVCPVHDATAEGRAARRARVVALTREGRSATDIAFIVGITARNVSKHRAAAGLTAGYVRADRLSEDELLAAKVLLVDGASYAEVGRTLGRSPDTLAKHLPGYAWTKADAARQSILSRQLRELAVL
jgi:DNA-binding CsgD family transcriptional regulator